MSSSAKNEDLRITKTVKALNDALFSLLERQSFKKITVKDLCEEALTSRATFYTHFIDKYELLEYCLTHSSLMDIKNHSKFEHVEEAVNTLVQNNKRVITNLVYDADAETIAIISDVILSTLDISQTGNDDQKNSSKYLVLSNFYAGGMTAYLLWQVNNKFSLETKTMNEHVYEIIKKFREWSSE